MSPNGMDAGHWTLACAAAELRLARVREVPAPEAEAVDDGLSGGSVAQFRRSFGDHWVPGQVVLSARTLEFRPRDAARATPLAVSMDALVSIEASSRLFGQDVRVRLDTGEVLTLRCRSAANILEQLQSAAGAARANAA